LCIYLRHVQLTRIAVPSVDDMIANIRVLNKWPVECVRMN
jgi:hypothetical protein